MGLPPLELVLNDDERALGVLYEGALTGEALLALPGVLYDGVLPLPGVLTGEGELDRPLAPLLLLPDPFQETILLDIYYIKI
ncbi:hypothetical protein BST79_gp140 [Only Syngen Nebraska virus 5]|uniref:hypothetical protein n=1 Tax=Only Syngen Nebraska virus 5 TaxID=1917232 RepID=UPI0009020139|nr:hypothetical protein BST79_gp140 [Only Syngen Nebraska virus 5]APC25653.1 hypothetical protein [Only Syngen Nebraska virus 5]